MSFSNTLKSFVAATLVLMMLGANAAAADRLAYVVNTSGETLSRINLTTGQVDNDVLTIGSDVLSYPNQIVVRDSMAYVIASGTNELQVINLKSMSTVEFISTGAGTNPFWMAFLDSQYVYVSNLLTNDIAKIDVLSAQVVRGIPVNGLAPEGVMIADGLVYVAVTGYDFSSFSFHPGKVVAIDPSADTIVSEILVGTNPQYLAMDPDGRVHVLCTGDYFSSFGIVYVIDPTTRSVVDSVDIGGSPGNLTVSPDGLAYIAAGGWVGDGYVNSYHSLTGEVFHGSANPIVVDSGCMMVVAYQDSSCFVGGFKDFVKPIDSSGATLDAYAVGDGPAHVAFNYVPGDVDGDFSVNIVDLSRTVDWLFSGGPAPRWPAWRANMNADQHYNIIDLTYLVAYLFSGGPAPKVGPTWLPR